MSSHDSEDVNHPPPLAIQACFCRWPPCCFRESSDQETPDSPEAMKTVPGLELADIPKEMLEI